MTSKARAKKSADQVAIPGYRALQRVSQEHGDAFYVYDEAVFVGNFRALLDAFRAHYAPTTIAYSYKTNYLPALCLKAHELGGFAEIVSRMEYDMVKALKIADERVIFNGPCKDLPTIESILRGGGIVNVDSPADVAAVLAAARNNPRKTLRVGIRCNLRDRSLPPSRFGLDVGGTEFRDAVKSLRGRSNVKLAGLHCHYPNRDLDSFGARTRALLKLCDYLWDEPPEFLNLGGGFAGAMPPMLRAQFSYEIPTYRDYAQCVAKEVAARFGASGPERPRLFIEPGTGVVANCMSFVAKISSVKNVRGTKVAVASGSVFNTSPTAKHLGLPVRIFARSERRTRQRTDIVGYTCIEGDYLARGLTTSVEAGDFAVVDNVGSYSIVMKPPFILPNVPVLRLGPRGETLRVLKRAEQSADVFRTFFDFRQPRARRSRSA